MSMHFQESRGIANNRRTLKLAYSCDPLGLGEYDWYRFEREVFDLWETETFARTVLNGDELKKGSTYNDHYGFGSSFETIIRDDAQRMFDKYKDTGAVVEVVVRLKKEVCIWKSKGDGFYHGSIKHARVPFTWLLDKEKPEYEDRPADESSCVEYIIWENGSRTAAYGELEQKLHQLRLSDESEGIRYDPEGKWRENHNFFVNAYA
ncbi:MAG: hypothetical protein NXH88_07180 [Hyphomonas sp.]|nr:hypothetical protein [Hyphomonas sp.]